MKVISIGREYQIHDDSMKTYYNLPPQVYYLRFSKFKGFYLELQNPIVIKESKIYGVHTEKVHKVLNGFQRTNKNFGVILSGNKGIGKSLFAKLLSKTAIEQGYPVIIIDSFMPEISSVLEDIEQEVVVLFDEFDKTFGGGEDDNTNPQDTLLSLFDGLSNGKKLFVVTCNVLRNLSDYLVNRPGRFHYHFRFDYPSISEIDEYMHDKLEPQYYGEIEKVKRFSVKIDLNYDCLCAIAFELNTGLPFEEAIKDLNIMNTETEKYNLTLYFDNGEIMTAKRVCIDMFENTETREIHMTDIQGREIDYIEIMPNEFEYDVQTGTNIIPAEKIRYSVCDYYDDEPDYEVIKALRPTKLIAERVRDKNLHYVL